MSEDWRNKINLNDKIWEEKQEKAQKLWDAQLWSEYFRVSYITFEIKLESLYLHENRKTFPVDMDLLVFLREIQGKYPSFIFDETHVHKWRVLRNEIAHRDKEIDQVAASQAKQYFDQMNSSLDELLEKYISPKIEYEGVEMVKSDYELLQQIQNLTGTKVPHYSETDFQSLYGFSEQDGFLTTLAIDDREMKGNLEELPRPELIDKIYIHGTNFLKISDWLRKIVTPNNLRRSTGIRIIVVEGEKWSQNVRGEVFTRYCSIRQMSMENALETEEIFRDRKARVIQSMILDASHKYARIYLEELAELMKMDLNTRILYQVKTPGGHATNRLFIMDIIEEMLNKEEIKGIFFNSTSAVVFTRD